jgi:PAS domain-containing protein
VLLETRQDVVPSGLDAFLIVDARLMVQAMSRTAERLLGVAEDLAVRRPVAELLVPADAESEAPQRFAGAVAESLGQGDDLAHAFVRPWNTFGVRMRVRIAACGPPRAALLVLDAPARGLRAVDD